MKYKLETFYKIKITKLELKLKGKRCLHKTASLH